MSLRVVFAVGFVCLVGCHRHVVESGAGDSLAATEPMGVELDEPDLEDGVYRVNTRETVGQRYEVEQIAQLPVGEICTVELTAPGRTIRGRIREVRDDILILADAEESVMTTTEQGVPMMNNLPYVQRLFKNVGVAVVERQLGSETISAAEISSITVERQPESSSEGGLPDPYAIGDMQPKDQGQQ